MIPWFPLNAGKLTRPLAQQTETSRAQTKGPTFISGLTPADEEIVKRVEKVAKDKKWSMAQVAYVWAKEQGTLPILGLSKVERIDEMVEAVGWTLTAEESKFLEEPYVSKAIMLHA
jgi:aryl-alcohol dehydrogenase-like predicted oxidoreductase